MEKIKVLIADDHRVVREGLAAILKTKDDIQVIGEAQDGIEAVEKTRALLPDVILMDVSMPRMSGVEATRQIKREFPHIGIVALTMYEEQQYIFDLVRAGATGYLLKDVLKADLLRALRDAAKGRPSLHPEVQQHLMREIAGKTSSQEQAPLHTSLTEREIGILRLLAEGRSNKEIATALHLTEGTIKGYVSTIFDKLDVEDRTQAALYAVKHRLAR